MTDNPEKEFKLRTTEHVEIATIDAALAELDVAVQHRPTRRHVDVYLDDDEASLLRAGVGLRVRDAGGGPPHQITVKCRRQGKGRLLVRDELDAEWPDEQLPSRADELPVALRQAVAGLVEDRPLRAPLRLVVHREVRQLGDDACELAIDFVEAHANGRSTTFQEIELEVRRDERATTRLAKQLQQRLPARFAKDDKPSFAAAHLGIEARPAPTAEERALAPVAAGLRPRLTAQLATLHRATAAVRAEATAEAVREQRTAARRLRVVVDAFAGLWPEPVHRDLRTALRELGRRLGEVRDLDVLISHTAEQVDALPPLLQDPAREALDELELQRERAAAELTGWLAAGAGTDAMQRFAAALAEPAAGEPRPEGGLRDTTLLHAARAALADAMHRLRRRLARTPRKRLPTDDAHRLRLAVKRAHELATCCRDLPGMKHRTLRKALARARRRLGDVCDHDRAAMRLVDCSLAGCSPDGADPAPARAAAFGALAALRTIGATVARPLATDALDRLDRRKLWRRADARAD